MAIVIHLSDNANVHCMTGLVPEPGQCEIVARDMPASMTTNSFGYTGDTTVDYRLPLEIASRKLELGIYNPELIDDPPKEPSGGCAAVLSILPETTETSTWYSIWEAVDAVTQMCYGDRKVGRASGIGTSRG